MKKIKIAHLVNQLYYAGKEAGIIKISSKINPDLFDIEIVVLGKVSKTDRFGDDSLPTIELNKPPGNSVKILYQLASIFRRKKYHIIYTHAWNTLLEGYLPAVAAGVPAKIHGEHGTFERSAVKDKLQKTIWNRFDAVTVVAGDLKKKMQHDFSYTQDNIHVIHNGIDAGRFHPDSAARAAFRRQYQLENKFVVGTVGRYHAVKDHPTLIRGFALFKKKCPHAKLVLVGSEKGDKMQQKYTTLTRELAIADDVLFLPAMAHVEHAVNSFDTFVLSSISEGCSNVILEALACGVPVVATRAGGNTELIQEPETGILFEVGNPEALATCLSSIQEHEPLRLKLQKNGPVHIAKKFTIEKTVSNYENLYQNLYESRKAYRIDS